MDQIHSVSFRRFFLKKNTVLLVKFGGFRSGLQFRPRLVCFCTWCRRKYWSFSSGKRTTKWNQDLWSCLRKKHHSVWEIKLLSGAMVSCIWLLVAGHKRPDIGQFPVWLSVAHDPACGATFLISELCSRFKAHMRNSELCSHLRPDCNRIHHKFRYF